MVAIVALPCHVFACMNSPVDNIFCPFYPFLCKAFSVFLEILPVRAVCYLSDYPATCGPKGHGSSSAAAYAASGVTSFPQSRLRPKPFRDNSQRPVVIIGLPFRPPPKSPARFAYGTEHVRNCPGNV